MRHITKSELELVSGGSNVVGGIGIIDAVMPPAGGVLNSGTPIAPPIYTFPKDNGLCGIVNSIISSIFR